MIKLSIDQKIVESPDKEFDDSLGRYFLGKVNSAHKEILKLANQYKKYQLKRMIAINPYFLNPKSNRFSQFSDDSIVTLKKDGEFNLFYYDTSNEPMSIFVNAPFGRTRYNLSVDKQINRRIGKINSNPNERQELQNLLLNSIGSKKLNSFTGEISRLVLAGELHADISREGYRPRASDFIKITKSPTDLESLNQIHYDVFDILQLNEIDFKGLCYESRLKIVDFMFPRRKKKKVKVIKYLTSVESKNLLDVYKKWVIEEKQEGIVIHDPYNKLYKVKEVHTIDAVIIGYVEMLKEKRIKGQNSISALLMALMQEDGSYQVLGIVGGGFSEEQRIDFYNLLSKDITLSSYRETNKEGRAFRFVKPKYVIQIKYLDLISEDYEGNPKLKMSLKFTINGWKIKNITNFISLISPFYDILRTPVNNEIFKSLEYINPKSPIYEDISVNQVYNLKPVETPTSKSETEVLPKSKILVRLVFEVRWSGENSARKILLWKTNKPINFFSKFIVYYADYNYHRKKPLKQYVYPFYSLKKALDHLNYILLRPDNPQKSFFDTKTQSALKKSIVYPPYSTYFNQSIEDKAKSILDERIKRLLI